METDLIGLNQQMAALEQQRGRPAQSLFTKLLSDQLLLRRANGKVIGKADFLQSLCAPSPFTQHSVEQLEIAQLAEVEKRTMVTLLMRTEDRYGAVRCFRHIRYFTRSAIGWRMEFWYVYEDVCG